jgi:transketolase C-terminal domain/subunit
VQDRYGQSGTVEELWQEYDLDCASIVEKVIEISTKESKK